MASENVYSGPAYAVFTATKLFTTFLTAVCYLLASILFTPYDLGQYTLSFTWIFSLTTLAQMNLSQSSIYILSRNKNQDIGKLVAGLLILFVAFCLVVTTVGFLAGHFFAENLLGSFSIVHFWISLLAVPVYLFESIFTHLALALGKAPALIRLTIYGRLLSLIGFLGALFLLNDVTYCLIGTILGQLFIAVALAASLLWRREFQLLPDFSLVKDLLRSGSKLQLNSIGSLITNYLDVLLVNRFIGVGVAGQYTMAKNIIEVFLLPAHSLSQLTFGQIGKLGTAASWLAIKKLFLLVLFAYVTVIPLLYLALPLADRFLDLPLVQISSLVQYASFTLPGSALAILMAPFWIGMGFLVRSGIVTILVSMLSLSALFVMLPRFGVYGAIYSMYLVSAISIVINGTFLFIVNSRTKT